MGQEYNRDGQPKAARQGLATVEVRPLAKNWRDPSFEWGENLVDWQETPHRDKRYQAYATAQLPSNATLSGALHDSALIMLYSHSNGQGGNQWIAPGNGVLCGKQYTNFDPDVDLSLGDFTENEAGQLYFVNFVGCYTALDDEEYGCLIDAAFTAGANITGGFQEAILTGDYGEMWLDRFYYYACVEGITVYWAQYWAAEAVKARFDCYGGYDTYFLKPWYRRDEWLVPARFGWAN